MAASEKNANSEFEFAFFSDTAISPVCFIEHLMESAAIRVCLLAHYVLQFISSPHLHPMETVTT